MLTVTKQYIADKVSGMEVALFAISVLPEVVKESDFQFKFQFHFHAITINFSEERADEWVMLNQFQEESKKILLFIQKPQGINYFFTIQEKISTAAQNLNKQAKQIIKNITKFSEKELISTFQSFMNNYIASYGLGAVTFIFEDTLSKQLSSSLPPNIDLNAILKSNYQSFFIQSERHLAQIKLSNNQKEREKLIKQYIQNYYFIDSTYKKAVKIDRKKILAKITECHPAKKVAQQEKNKTKIVLQPEQNKIISLLKIAEVIRDQRKKINMIGNYIMYLFLEEAAKRKNLNFDLIKNIFWHEFPDLFSKTEQIIKKAEKRTRVSLVWDGKIIKEYENIVLKQKKEDNLKTKEIKGTPACQGSAEGIVKIILTSKDFSKLQKGEILVAQMTRPDYLPLFKKAIGVITDEGGLTCHAAIVSRELGIPCIVGTKNATEVLKDGDKVFVDANHGVIKILK